MLEYRKAVVLDNIDLDKEGRIKVRILPEMNGVDESLLKWIYPFLLPGGGGQNGTHDVPEIGEYVTVVIKDKYWINIEYISADYTIDNYPYSSFETIAGNISELGSQTYPQPKYLRKFNDGTIMFHNSDTGESGIYNNNGSYIIFDSTGKIIEKSNYGISLDGSTSGKIKIRNSSATLHTILKDTITVLKNLITPLNLVDSLKSPVVYTQVGVDLPKMIIALSQIDQLMED